jgi:hypothetical protein
VFAREIEGEVFTFGVSGLLYKSNVLMYDRQTESLWSQVKRAAVTGPMTGTRLKVLPSSLTTWGKWKKRFPETEVLSLETGYERDYSRDPYEEYYESKKGIFSFFKPGPGEEEKQLVVGITINDAAKAYSVDYLREKGRLRDQLGGETVTLAFDPRTDSLSVKDAKGKDVPHVVLYWFVWKGMNPDSPLFRPGQ